MVEHGTKIDEFGTPRAFEIIPYWTNMWTMEGTLMEASITAPFHFINQAELSKEPSNAIIGVDYPSLDVAKGITHLQLMNIPYFISCTAEVTTATEADPRAELLATFGDYNIWRISGMTGYVEVMQNQPVRVDILQADWRDMAVQWYENMDDLETPIIWDNGDEALRTSSPRSPLRTPPTRRRCPTPPRGTSSASRSRTRASLLTSIRPRSASRSGSRSRISPTGT